MIVKEWEATDITRQYLTLDCFSCRKIEALFIFLSKTVKNESGKKYNKNTNESKNNKNTNFEYK